MKKIRITLAALVVVLATACEKEEILPQKRDPQDKIINCRTCDGTWDITDPKP